MRVAFRMPAARGIALPKVPTWLLALVLVIGVPAAFAAAARGYMIYAWTYYGGNQVVTQASMDYVNAQVALMERVSYLSSGTGAVRFQWDSAPSSQATRHAVTDLGSIPMKPLRPKVTKPGDEDDVTRIVKGPSGVLAVAVTGRGMGHCKRPLKWLSSYTRARIRVARIATPSRYDEQADVSDTSITWGNPGEWDAQCGASEESGTILIRFD